MAHLVSLMSLSVCRTSTLEIRTISFGGLKNEAGNGESGKWRTTSHVFSGAIRRACF